jgi:hypothetical protein
VLHQHYQVSVSTAYYHLSDNRQAYEYEARKKRAEENERAKQVIRSMLKAGYTTGDIASLYNVPLVTVNKLYVG